MTTPMFKVLLLTVIALVSPQIQAASGLIAVGSSGGMYHFVDSATVRREGHLVRYQLSGRGVRGTEGTYTAEVGADCVLRTRIEYLNTRVRADGQVSTSSAFLPNMHEVLKGTGQDQELTVACQLAKGEASVQPVEPTSIAAAGPTVPQPDYQESEEAAQLPTTNQLAISTIGRRVALIIGNAAYKIHPLRNPRNDADDVSRSLKGSGFEVIDLRDASLSQMRSAIRQFGDKLLTSDTGLVYYSGHGIEIRGRNYFIPVNADIQREDEVADQSLDVSLILEKMSTAQKAVNILIVDACRDDPFGRSFRSSSKGLAPIEAPRGTIVAYATSPGKVAADGDGRNSPYTKHLVRAMQAPNKPIELVFKEVRRAVQDETKNLQTPWENTSLSGDFFFRIQK